MNIPLWANQFEKGILRNLRYWYGRIEVPSVEVTTLSHEREGIIRAISFALPLNEAWPLVYQVIIAFSSYMERWGEWETWRQILSEAIAVAQNTQYQAEAADLGVTLALMLQRQSRIRTAISRYQQTIKLARQAGNQMALARTYTNLGYLYTEQGYWWRAEILCCQALTLFEQIDSIYGCAHTHNHLGVLYSRQGRWDQAWYQLEQACTLWQSSGDDHGLLRGYINFSLLYLKLEQPQPALDYLHKALKQAEQTDDKTEIGPIYVNMAIAHELRGDLTQAVEYSRQAETLFQQQSNLTELARVWGNVSLVYIKQRRWSEANAHLEKSLEIWRMLRSKTGEIETVLNFIEYEITRGDRQRAEMRIQEAEALITHVVGATNHYHYHTQLEWYRRSLSDQSTTLQTAAE